jgi:hypothetical protein
MGGREECGKRKRKRNSKCDPKAREKKRKSRKTKRSTEVWELFMQFHVKLIVGVLLEDDGSRECIEIHRTRDGETTDFCRHKNKAHSWTPTSLSAPSHVFSRVRCDMSETDPEWHFCLRMSSVSFARLRQRPQWIHRS